MKFTHSRGEEQGGILPFIVVVIATLVVLVGMAVDSARNSYHKDELQHAADETLKAMINAIAEDNTLIFDGENVGDDPNEDIKKARVRDIALEILRSNLDLKGMDPTQLVDADFKIDSNVRSGGFINMDATFQTSNVFLGVMDVATTNVRVDSRIALTEVWPLPVDVPDIVVIALDYSNYDTESEFKGIWEGAQRAVSRLNAGDYVGVITYHRSYFNFEEHSTIDWRQDTQFKNLILDIEKINDENDRQEILDTKLDYLKDPNTETAEDRVCCGAYMQGGIHMARQLFDRAHDLIKADLGEDLADKAKKILLLVTTRELQYSSWPYKDGYAEYPFIIPGELKRGIPTSARNHEYYGDVQLDHKRSCSTDERASFPLNILEADMARDAGVEMYTLCLHHGCTSNTSEWDKLAVMKRIALDVTLDMNQTPKLADYITTPGGDGEIERIREVKESGGPLLYWDWMKPIVFATNNNTGEVQFKQKEPKDPHMRNGGPRWNFVKQTGVGDDPYCGYYDQRLFAEKYDADCSGTNTAWCKKKRYYASEEEGDFVHFVNEIFDAEKISASGNAGHNLRLKGVLIK